MYFNSARQWVGNSKWFYAILQQHHTSCQYESNLLVQAVDEADVHRSFPMLPFTVFCVSVCVAGKGFALDAMNNWLNSTYNIVDLFHYNKT